MAHAASGSKGSVERRTNQPRLITSAAARRAAAIKTGCPRADKWIPRLLPAKWRIPIQNAAFDTNIISLFLQSASVKAFGAPLVQNVLLSEKGVTI
jgi:hypothetical protein